MFKFSVIIPIFNAEQYLKEAIDSVINQTVGFKNIQLILVNDGSIDDSEKICNNYQSLYPDNIIYIRQNNYGVSTARNHGFSCATGKYINFLDADDKWSSDAFEKAEKLFEQDDSIHIVAAMLEYFDGKKGLSHPLNWKFTNDMIINLNEEPSKIQMHIASCFIKYSAIKDLSFDTKLEYAEDALLINQILLDKLKYGILSSSHYMYRKRRDGSSALDSCTKKESFYNNTIDHFHIELINSSYNRYGYVIPYIQYVLMYDLQWRIKKEIPEYITNPDDYRKKIAEILDYIDDEIIMKQHNLWIEHKILALSMKYKQDIVDKMYSGDDGILFKGIMIQPYICENILNVLSIDVNKNTIKIKGIINTPIAKNAKFYIQDQEKNTYDIVYHDLMSNEKICLYGHYYYDKIFTIEIPIIDNLKLSFIMKFLDEKPATLRVNIHNTCRMPKSKFGYLKLSGHIIEKTMTTLQVRKNNILKHLKLETRFCLHIFKYNSNIVFYRMMAYIFCFFLKTKFFFKDRPDIHILSDRNESAGDNGEAFFKYLNQQNMKRIYFAISRKSPDYHRMKTIGKVLNMDSVLYKIMFLCADFIVSSQANDNIINPFGNDKRFIKDLYKYKFVFLQHGIIKDDLSDWLNISKKDIWMFITSAPEEYLSIIEGKYGYDKCTIKLTGLPRYDNLCNLSTKNKIAIVPTWRNGIQGCVKNGIPIFNEKFKETEFYQFYNALINNERLLLEMKKHNCFGVFCLHPMFSPQKTHFSNNDVFKIVDGSYHDIIENYDLLITDYSSIFFDFAYLKKPVIYAQFDEEDFFKQHSYQKGYFDYEKDGFGKITKTVEETVDEIIYQMNAFTLEDEYLDRVEKFFQFNDCNNCERVYNEIQRMKE